MTWRRAQIVLWSAQDMAVATDRCVRVHLRGPSPRGYRQLQCRRVRLARTRAMPVAGLRRSRCHSGARSSRSRWSRPQDHGWPFSTWSLSKLAEFLVAEGVVDDISHEGLRVLLREEGVSFQAMKTLKQSNDPDFERRRTGSSSSTPLPTATSEPGPGDPTVMICVDEFGPLNLQPHPGRQWAPVAAGTADRAARGGGDGRPTTPPRSPPSARRLRLIADRLYGHIVPTKERTEFLRSCATSVPSTPLRCVSPSCIDNFSPHLSANKDERVGQWAVAQQRRTRLHAALRVMAQPDRSPVPGVALLLP